MRRVIIFLLFIFVSIGLKAQFSVGLRQGYGSHGIYLEPPYLTKHQVPYYRSNTGLVIVYNNINNAGLQVEINYAQKGWQEKDTAVEGSYFKKNINYLEVPIFSHWEMGYGKIRPILFAGPYFAFKLNESSDSANFSHIWYENGNYTHYEQEIRTFGFGIKLGIGLRYNITSRLGIYIDARYDMQVAGSRDIFTDRPDGIQASRLKEVSGTFGIIWHIIRQPKKETIEGYTPKEDLFVE